MKERIYALEKNLGMLRQIDLGDEEEFRFVDVSIYRLIASVRTIRCWSDYGQFKERRLSLCLDGKQDNIKLNGITIFYVVKDILKFYLSRNGCHHNFTINWQIDNGDIYEQSFSLYCEADDNLLPHIVYAILLISEVKNEEMVQIYWDMLTNGSFPINNTIGKNLDDANNLRKIIDKIVQEYPFTEKFFQDGMKNITCFLKKEIDKIELH